MHRRGLLKRMGAITLYSSFPAILSEFTVSCNGKEKSLRAGFFSKDEFHLTELVSDTIIPATTTPGALDVHVPFFIELVVKNCMNNNDQQLIKKGLLTFDDQPAGKFASLSKAEKLQSLKKLDEGAFKGDADKTWFLIFKKLATIGYFTSQDGMTKALNYVKVPGDYNACIPYRKGEKALAKTFLLYW